MNLNKRGNLILLLSVISGLLISVLIYCVYDYVQTDHTNSLITSYIKGEHVELKEGNYSVPELQFAYAYSLHKRQLFDEAADAYGHADRLAQNSSKRNIQFNLGNLYLESALNEAEKGGRGIDRAMALADTAKGFYRLALKLDPKHWPSKYNYEAAQRISRDLPLNESISNEEEGMESSEELWSAMPGFPIGLP